MFFTVANHNNEKNIKGFVNYDDVEFADIPDMVTAGYCYVACKLKNEERRDSNFDGYVDVLIADIDAGCTIEEAKQIFSSYEFWLITSKSHQKEKNGLVCDRFRMFFKLNKTIHIKEKFDELYKRFIDKFSFVDRSCRNVSRLYYSSPKDAIVIYNKGKEYSTNIIDTNESEQKKPIVNSETIYKYCELTNGWIDSDGSVLQEYNQDAHRIKLKGAKSLLDKEFYKGNRNNALFKCASMLLKDGFSEQDIVKFLVEQNDERDSVKFNELMNCIKSAIRLF